MNVPLLVAMRDAGLRGYILAAAAGMTPSRFSKILNAGATPTNAERERIAAILGRSADELFPQVETAAAS
jgi:transcriptional regulator with XRE-family HTH domain